MFFKKKPVIIEAIQWDGKIKTLQQLSAMGMETSQYAAGGAFVEIASLHIKTLEGEHLVQVGDWIIRGVQGEFYSCRLDIFELTYEPYTIAE